jgi:diguanylate cyclase (GGDEF)-like protein
MAGAEGPRRPAVDWQDIVRALDHGVVQRDLVLGIRGATGVRWLSVTAAPIVRDDRVRHVVVTLVDVSDARERELALRRLSQLDDLTGLPNRRRFVELLDRHLASQRREDAGGAVLLIDLDRFKELNDTFGHAAGDRLLVQVAHAIRERLREHDVLARLGGDEVAVLLKRASASDAANVAQALVERLNGELAPAPHGGTRPVGASIGAVALAGAATGTAERALARAHASMYRAKESGRAAWRIEGDDAPGVGDQLAKRSRQLALANAVGARLAGQPLVVEGDIWGALNVEETTPDAFDHDDVILLSTLANQVSAALRAANLLKRLADADALGTAES